MTRKTLLTLLYVGVVLGACALKTEASVFSTPPSGSKGPDSLTNSPGSVWVSYNGGTNTTGTDPNSFSTIVQYTPSGAVQQEYKIQGSVDGLRYNSFTGQVWALQNEDANPHITIISPTTGTLTAMSYAANPTSQTSTPQGYDDIQFTKKGAYISETNPTVPGDTTLVKVVPGTSPVVVTPVLTSGSPGLNVNTGKTGFVPSPQPVDTDSLILAPDGITLYQTTGANRDTIAIYNTTTNALKYLTLTQNGQSVSAMDDTQFITSTHGILYASATTGGTGGLGEVDKFNINLPTGTLLASIGSLDEIAIVDQSTGDLTPFLTGLDGIHGLDFVPTVVPETSTIVTGAIALIGGLLIAVRRRQKAVA
jgi:hypothetical protein